MSAFFVPCVLSASTCERSIELLKSKAGVFNVTLSRSVDGGRMKSYSITCRAGYQTFNITEKYNGDFQCDESLPIDSNFMPSLSRVCEGL